MVVWLLVLAILNGLPLLGFAQFVDKGEYVVVAKGTQLCVYAAQGTPRAMLDPEKLFWRVTSNVWANGTQTVAAFVLEALYDRKSGETVINACKYDLGYATLFKRDPEYKRGLFMVSPKDGQVEARVEICEK